VLNAFSKGGAASSVLSIVLSEFKKAMFLTMDSELAKVKEAAVKYFCV